MGCGTSANQMDNVVPPSNSNPIQQAVVGDIPDIKQSQKNQPNQHQLSHEVVKADDRVMTAATQQLKHEAMKHVPEGRAFIFGQSQNQRKILLLDSQKMQFSILSSKNQAPNTPQKYVPKDIIFEQSQQMLASNLFNKNSHPPYNFMFITFVNDQTIFLCGGVNYSFDYFSEQAFLFKVSSITGEQPQAKRKKGGNNLVGNKFQKLSCMKSKRYSHMGAYFKIGKLGYIFIFGGRDEDDNLLNTCQQYSIQEKKWRQITPMKSPRSTGFSLIFKNKIYVFGGYSGEKKRSKIIQVYDPFKDYWQILNVKLHRGIEVGLLFSIKSNQILLMGGNMEMGPLKSTIKINLAEQTYIWDSNMKNQRLLQKGIKYKDTIFVFGGDNQDNFQKYSVKDRKWKDLQFSYSQFIAIDDINSYQMATQTLQVTYDETIITKVDNTGNDFDRFHIFGNDNFPCILELNLNKWVLKKKSVPMTLRLRSQMGVVKIVQGKYFICGGVDSVDLKPSRASYIYYAGTNKAIQVAKLHSKKYNFAIVATSKHVFVFGGKNQQGDVINECQFYSFEQQVWKQLPNMPTERAGSKALLIGTKIYLFGGSDSLQMISAIDVFDTQSLSFMSSSQSLSISADIKAVFIDSTTQVSAPSVYILSHNQILNKYSIHYLQLNLKSQASQPTSQQLAAIQSIQIPKHQQQKQINVKVLPFSHSFAHNGKYNFITGKGLFNWTPTFQTTQNKTMQSQIVINQVEMMQFPIQRFSSA